MKDKREHSRHDCEQKIFFDFVYDFKAKVGFQRHKKPVPARLEHEGTTSNVSTQGLCFSSDIKLLEGDIIDIEVHVPGLERPVKMQGEVRWNKIISINDDGDPYFNTGVILKTIEGRDVNDTIKFDDQYNIYWSEVLESLLGNFRIYQQKKNNEQK